MTNPAQVPYSGKARPSKESRSLTYQFQLLQGKAPRGQKHDSGTPGPPRLSRSNCAGFPVQRLDDAATSVVALASSLDTEEFPDVISFPSEKEASSDSSSPLSRPSSLVVFRSTSAEASPSSSFSSLPHVDFEHPSGTPVLPSKAGLTPSALAQKFASTIDTAASTVRRTTLSSIFFTNSSKQADTLGTSEAGQGESSGSFTEQLDLVGRASEYVGKNKEYSSLLSSEKADSYSRVRAFGRYSDGRGDVIGESRGGAKPWGPSVSDGSNSTISSPFFTLSSFSSLPSASRVSSPVPSSGGGTCTRVSRTTSGRSSSTSSLPVPYMSVHSSVHTFTSPCPSAESLPSCPTSPPALSARGCNTRSSPVASPQAYSLSSSKLSSFSSLPPSESSQCPSQLSSTQRPFRSPSLPFSLGIETPLWSFVATPFPSYRRNLSPPVSASLGDYGLVQHGDALSKNRGSWERGRLKNTHYGKQGHIPEQHESYSPVADGTGCDKAASGQKAALGKVHGNSVSSPLPRSASLPTDGRLPVDRPGKPVLEGFTVPVQEGAKPCCTYCGSRLRTHKHFAHIWPEFIMCTACAAHPPCNSCHRKAVDAFVPIKKKQKRILLPAVDEPGGLRLCGHCALLRPVRTKAELAAATANALDWLKDNGIRFSESVLKYQLNEAVGNLLRRLDTSTALTGSPCSGTALKEGLDPHSNRIFIRARKGERNMLWTEQQAPFGDCCTTSHDMGTHRPERKDLSPSYTIPVESVTFVSLNPTVHTNIFGRCETEKVSLERLEKEDNTLGGEREMSSPSSPSEDITACARLVRRVSVVRGLPDVLFRGHLVHELLHAFLWCHQPQAESLRLDVEEGMCNASSAAVFRQRLDDIRERELDLGCAGKSSPELPPTLEKYVLQESTEVRKDLELELLRFEARVIEARLEGMERDPHACYGRGYRAMRKLVTVSGLAAVVSLSRQFGHSVEAMLHAAQKQAEQVTDRARRGANYAGEPWKTGRPEAGAAPSDHHDRGEARAGLLLEVQAS
ncbi:hypothetical protein CSUI_005060 [Cystoisospora suis]|uniref:Protein DA1-like domain-containing protein n=1 Tax=Cystoisospora suis TaxID=483139 RepID=A0A2C6KYZ5_9APIC|nr:hypothetical protein CSUI_005060 [Cystoisospora suis]